MKKDYSQSQLSSMIHFVSSDSQAVEKFKSNGVKLTFPASSIQVQDFATGNTFSLKKNAEQSANELIGPEYSTNIKDGKIFAGEKLIFHCFEKTNCPISKLAEDLASVNEISRLLRNEGKPTILIFHLKSLQSFKEFTNINSQIHLVELINSSFKKVIILT